MRCTCDLHIVRYTEIVKAEGIFLSLKGYVLLLIFVEIISFASLTSGGTNTESKVERWYGTRESFERGGGYSPDKPSPNASALDMLVAAEAMKREQADKAPEKPSAASRLLPVLLLTLTPKVVYLFLGPSSFSWWLGAINLVIALISICFFIPSLILLILWFKDDVLIDHKMKAAPT